MFPIYFPHIFPIRNVKLPEGSIRPENPPAAPLENRSTTSSWARLCPDLEISSGTSWEITIGIMGNVGHHMANQDFENEKITIQTIRQS
jgi:hypothetical protein